MSAKNLFPLKALLAMLSFSVVACNLTGRIGLLVPTPKTTVVATVTFQPDEPTHTPVVTVSETAPTEVSYPATLRVVFTSENDIYLWKDGVLKRITSTKDAYTPLISPDGELIAFMRPVDDYHLEIWSVRADGTDERKLVSFQDLDALGASKRDPNAMAVIPNSEYVWMPGSHSLGFTTQQIFQGPGLILLDDLHLVDADTGKITTLLQPGSGGVFEFSPDGSMIAVVQPDRVILARVDGSEYWTVLTYDQVTTYSEYRFYAQPLWSPAGDYLMVAIPPADPLAKPMQPTEVWRIKTDRSQAEKVAALQAVAFMERPVSFSPDLRWIAYLKEIGVPEDNLRELHLTRQDGSDDQVIASAAPIFFQSWSSDSTYYIYSTGQEQAAWLGSPNGSTRSLGDIFLGAHSSQWVNNGQFLYWLSKESTLELYLGSVVGASALVATVFDSRPYLSFVP